MRLYCVEDRRAPFVDAFVTSAKERGFTPQVITPNPSPPETYIKFMEVYRHLSINPEEFELACFRRYFEVANMIKGDNRFIIADSDLLFNAGPTDIPSIFIDHANTLVGSIGRANNIVESDISPHFSFWTPALIMRFVDYLIYAYESQLNRLENSFLERQRAGNKRASISDMTLLKMFMEDESVAFIDSNRIEDGTLIDHNFCMAECANATFKMDLGFKSFRRKNNDIHVITTSGESIRPIVIHLQGRAKIAAQPILQGQDYLARLRLGSIAAARQVRQWIA